MSRGTSPCRHCQKEHKGTCWTQTPSRAPRWWKKKHHRRIGKQVDSKSRRFHPFMRLPAELRICVYEHYFQPGRAPGLSCEGKIPLFPGCDYATGATVCDKKIRRCHDCGWASCKFSGALLLANKQVREEALPVLEDTFERRLNIAGDEYAKKRWFWDVEREHVWYWEAEHATGAIRDGAVPLRWYLEGFEPRPANIMHIHIDTCAIEEDTQHLRKLIDQLKCLHDLADRVTFIVEVHACGAWMSRTRAVADSESEKLAKAQIMREQLVVGLEAEFVKAGKTMRLREA